MCAERFAGKWKLYVRFRRRERWVDPPRLTREMLEYLIDALERRAQRSEGVGEADLIFVRKMLAELHDDDPG